MAALAEHREEPIEAACRDDLEQELAAVGGQLVGAEAAAQQQIEDFRGLARRVQDAALGDAPEDGVTERLPDIARLGPLEERVLPEQFLGRQLLTAPIPPDDLKAIG
jgi:hypothetical protein